METMQRKGFEHADEVRTFEKGRIEVVNIGGGTVDRITLEPGWRWSKHVKPLAKTEWCEAPHFLSRLGQTPHRRQ